jgi:hypothetical protein
MVCRGFVASGKTRLAIFFRGVLGGRWWVFLAAIAWTLGLVKPVRQGLPAANVQRQSPFFLSPQPDGRFLSDAWAC